MTESPITIPTGSSTAADDAHATSRRYEQLLRARGAPAEFVGRTLWTVYRRMAVPVGPPSAVFMLGPSESRDLLSRVPALLARWTDGIDAVPDSPWFSVICDRFTPVEELPSANTRSKIRRGLKRCGVEPVAAERIATEGYDVFMAAHERYRSGGGPNIERDQFARNARVDGDFPDLVEYFGVFMDGRLVGYSRNRLYGTTCVDYDVIKFAPDGLRSYASYALVQQMNDHYLGRRGVRMANDGFRSLSHETEFQDFLVHQFQFRRAPQRLFIRYRPWVAAAIRFVYPFRELAGRWNEAAKAALEQERIRRCSATA